MGNWVMLAALVAGSLAAEPPHPRSKEDDAGRSVVSVGATAGAGWGTSTYGLLASQEVEGIPGDVVAESALEWPMSGADLGFDVSWQAPRSSGHWGGWIRGRILVGSPLGRMIDEDWVTAKGLDLTRTKFSYTESRVDGGRFVGDAGFYLSRHPVGAIPSGGAWDFLFGYRHELVYLEAWGVEDGWQLEDVGKEAQVSLDPHVQAADFDGHHLYPYAGLLYRFRAGKRFRCDVRGVGTGFVAIETDDHVLRGKRMSGLAWGLGALVGIRPQWVFEKERSKGKVPAVSIGVELEAQYARTLAGTLKQEYYDDDPGVPGDQTGTEIPDSDYFAQVLRIGGDAFLAILF